MAGYNATAIDLMNSLEQDLIVREENGSLVIENLLVRDYPFMIRLTNGSK